MLSISGSAAPYTSSSLNRLRLFDGSSWISTSNSTKFLFIVISAFYLWFKPQSGSEELKVRSSATSRDGYECWLQIASNGDHGRVPGNDFRIWNSDNIGLGFVKSSSLPYSLSSKISLSPPVTPLKKFSDGKYVIPSSFLYLLSLKQLRGSLIFRSPGIDVSLIQFKFLRFWMIIDFERILCKRHVSVFPTPTAWRPWLKISVAAEQKCVHLWLYCRETVYHWTSKSSLEN